MLLCNMKGESHKLLKLVSGLFWDSCLFFCVEHYLKHIFLNQGCSGKGESKNLNYTGYCRGNPLIPHYAVSQINIRKSPESKVNFIIVFLSFLLVYLFFTSRNLCLQGIWVYRFGIFLVCYILDRGHNQDKILSMSV